MSDMDVIWRPQPGPQTNFCERDEFEVLYGGAKGGGKSEVLLMEGLRQIGNPRYHAGFFRRTYPQLQEMIDRSHQYFRRIGGTWRGAEHRWVFPSGARYDFRHLNNEEDKYNYQGQEFHYLAFDQLEQFTQSQYEYMVMQVRTSDPTIRTYVRGSANPGGIGHGWVKARWIDDKKPYKTYYREFGTELRISSCYIPAKVYDNKILLDANPLYLAQLMALPEELRAAMLEGNWDVFAGQYYPEFNQRVHVVDPFEIPAWWRKFRSLDYGLDMTACHWWAVAPDSRCYIYRELYQPNLNLTQAAEAICALTPAGEDVKYTVASPDLWNRRQETGVSGEEVMRKAGLRDLTKADDNRVPGWRVLREYLAPFPGETGELTAKLLIFRGKAPNLVRTLPTLIHDEHDVEDVADECEDHACEGVRYGCMSRPRKGVEPQAMLDPAGQYTLAELRGRHGMTDAQIRRLKGINILDYKHRR
jgi:phage terminase large subunit